MSKNFICELLLLIAPWQYRNLNIRFDAGRNLYNACLGESLKRLAAAKNSSDWKKASGLKRSAERSGLFRNALKEHHFSEYELHFYVKKLTKESWIRDHIDSQVAQKIATRAFQAVDEFAKSKRGKPRFKGIGQFSSIEGKSNVTGIRFKNGKIHWQGLILTPLYDTKDKHGVQAHGLSQRTKYVRLVRRKVRGALYFYAQLIQEGQPLIKKKNSLGKGKSVGLDIGPSSIALVSEESAVLQELTNCEENHKKTKILQRALEQSRKKTNPNNFDEKGIPLKNKQWKQSERYRKKQAQFAEEKRVIAASRKTQHGTLGNQILSMGTTIKAEKLNYTQFQESYGRSIARHAPGMLIEILRRKAENAGGQVIEFSPYQTKLSQTCHACGNTKKKSLNERWQICPCGLEPVQRDLYSAFLALHVDEGVLNRPRAKEAWASAGPLLQQALLRCEQTAIGNRKLASFGLSPSQSCSPVEGESTASEVKGAISENIDRFEELDRLVIRTPLR